LGWQVADTQLRLLSGPQELVVSGGIGRR